MKEPAAVRGVILLRPVFRPSDNRQISTPQRHRATVFVSAVGLTRSPCGVVVGDT